MKKKQEKVKNEIELMSSEDIESEKEAQVKNMFDMQIENFNAGDVPVRDFVQKYIEDLNCVLEDMISNIKNQVKDMYETVDRVKVGSEIKILDGELKANLHSCCELALDDQVELLKNILSECI